MYSELLKKLNSAFQENSNQENVSKMEAYMKHNFKFFGIKAPLRKSICRPIFKEYKIVPDKNFKSFIKNLWVCEEREFQYTAMDIMERKVAKMDESWIHFLESLVVQKSWWDSVDWIAANGIGRLLLKYPEDRYSLCRNWNCDENMWLNRVALLHQLKHREKTDFEFMQELILVHIGSQEFFINKAIGWALRQHHRYAPQQVVDFVSAYPELSNLSKREALKHQK